jgi:hypothetical protein
MVGSLILAAAAVYAIGGGDGGAPAAASAWSRRDLRPLTQPAPLAGRLVLLVAGGGGPQIIALDGRTGATVWSAGVSPSVIAPGEPPALASVGGLVVYLRRAGGQEAQLVGAEPSTGKILWQSQTGYFTSWPVPCSDDPAVVCTTGYLPSEGVGASYLRFASGDGTLLPAAAIAPNSTSARMLGAGLFDPGARQPEELLAVKGASVAWSRTLASIFTFAGASSDWGWNFDRIARVGLYVGSVGGAPLSSTRTRVLVDLSRGMTAGIRIADGSVVWRASGMQYVCNALPCPGADQAGWLDGAAQQGVGPTLGVGLRETGTAAGTAGDTASIKLSPDSTVTLSGFDPASGRTVWEFAAGHDVSLLTGLKPPPQTGANTIVLRNSGGRLLALDLATGRRAPTGPGTPAWCRSQTTYRESVPFKSTSVPEASLHTYVGQPSLYPCSASGARASVPKRIPTFVSAIGARIDGLVAWSDSRVVYAVP